MHDRGWSAEVNGNPAEVHKINAGFMGIMLKAGDNEVIMRYRTPGMVYFVAVSLLSVAAWLCLVLWDKKIKDGAP